MSERANAQCEQMAVFVAGDQCSVGTFGFHAAQEYLVDIVASFFDHLRLRLIDLEGRYKVRARHVEIGGSRAPFARDDTSACSLGGRPPVLLRAVCFFFDGPGPSPELYAPAADVEPSSRLLFWTV